MYKQTLINAKLQIGKRGQKTELTGRSPLSRRRSTLDCHASEEEELTVLYLFLVDKERNKWAVCTTFRNPILLGGELSVRRPLAVSLLQCITNR